MANSMEAIIPDDHSGTNSYPVKSTRLNKWRRAHFFCVNTSQLGTVKGHGSRRAGNSRPYRCFGGLRQSTMIPVWSTLDLLSCKRAKLFLLAQPAHLSTATYLTDFSTIVAFHFLDHLKPQSLIDFNSRLVSTRF